MAAERNKLIKDAEKLVGQGKLDAAAKKYEALVKQNPRDLNTMNKIGDLYSRSGKKKEAIAQFKKVCDSYEKDGFLPKAIAVYKKIIKLEPSNISCVRRLADLYARQGLVNEAKNHYNKVADRYRDNADIENLIETTRALIDLEPANIDTRTGLADLLAQQEKIEEAAKEYTQIGAELDRQGKHAEARDAYKKASEIEPDSPAMTARLAASHVASGDIESGIKLVKDGLKTSTDDVELLVLLGDIHVQAGQYEEALSTFEKAIEHAPERSDLRLRTARLHVSGGRHAEAFDAIEPALSALSSDKRGDTAGLLEEILELDSKHRGAWNALIGVFEASCNKDKTFAAAHTLLDICIDEADYAEGFKLAEKLVQLRPADPVVKEKLDLVRAAKERGDNVKAGKPAAVAPEKKTPVADVVPSMEDSVIDPRILIALDIPEPPALSNDDEDFIAEHMTEADVFVKYGLPDRAVEQLEAVVARFPGYVPALIKLKELHIEEGERDKAREQMVMLVKAYIGDSQRSSANEALGELRRFDPSCKDLGALTDALDPSSPGEAILEAVDDDEILTVEIDADDETVVAGAFVEESSQEYEASGPSQEKLDEVDALVESGDYEGAVVLLRDLADSNGPQQEILSRMKRTTALASSAKVKVAAQNDDFEIEIEDDILEAADEPVMEEAPSAPSDDLLDLASEIDAALGRAEDGESPIASVEPETEGHTLEEVVAAFKEGVEQEIDTDDFNTHYNLGIAYKEMGLMDEAIAEFQTASKDASLLLECCCMLGICFREKGMQSLAVKWYRKGVESGSVADEETILGLRYDLAEILLEMGESREALDLFTEIYGTNSKFRDVGDRMKQLENSLST